jgi:hypothetical protein
MVTRHPAEELGGPFRYVTAESDLPDFDLETRFKEVTVGIFRIIRPVSAGRRAPRG